MKPLTQAQAEEAMGVIAAWLTQYHPNTRTAMLVVEEDQENLHDYPMVAVDREETEEGAARRLSAAVLLRLDDTDFQAGGITGKERGPRRDRRGGRQ